MDDLETLISAQDPNAPVGIDVLSILRQHTFPRLRKLSLTYVTIPEDTLRGFIRRDSSLVSMTIEQPLMKRSQ